MKQTEIIMGMPITVEVVSAQRAGAISDVFDYFRRVDERYSTYKSTSEISHINAGLPETDWSDEMREVLRLCEETTRQTDGYFNAMRDGVRDPSGLVKGWAIHNAANQLLDQGIGNFYIEAGGDIEAHGSGEEGDGWIVGIRNPFNISEIVKVIRLRDAAIATSGTYIRGEHIYNPHDGFRPATTVASMSVIGPNIYDADRFATAAYAMGDQGVHFIQSLPGFEAYVISHNKVATYTSGLERYVVHATCN